MRTKRRRSVNPPRVAVIGAGLSGLTAALRLAEAGVPVTVFERNSTVFSGASLSCEGKIHLGYTYALDASGATARRMLLGAASFGTLLTRWVPKAALGLSDRPFVYAMPLDSMISEAAFKAHLTQVKDLADAHGDRLLRLPDAPIRRLSDADLSQHFDPERVHAAWQTDELASHPGTLRPHLLAALTAQKHIELRTSAEVTRLWRVQHGFALTARDSIRPTRFAAVINATWDQRLRFDLHLGLLPPGRMLHRFKFGLHATSKTLAKQALNVTFVLGEYGDTVACGDHFYLSWYPAGLLSQQVAPTPDPKAVTVAPSDAQQIIQRSTAGIARLMPAFGRTLVGAQDAFEVRGGYISSWGNTGIKDPKSRVHARSEIGVSSTHNYHSINTGKYTTAPLFGNEAAARVLAEFGIAG